MRFVLRMTVRELRASWRRLLFFFVCVAIGVGAIVALRSVIQNVRANLVREREKEKAAVEWEEGLSNADLHSLAGQAGKVLAEAHSGDAKAIREWIGKDR
jgi:predicted lysophospholipase L1 biosynthesis ABC-type transport system permease subunit